MHDLATRVVDRILRQLELRVTEAQRSVMIEAVDDEIIVHLQRERDATKSVRVVDLGDATEQTRQCSPIGPFWDSLYGHGWCMG